MAQSPYLTDPSNPITSEVLGLERQKKLAEMLQQRGMQTPQGQMVSGRYVAPAWTQYLANAFDAYSGGQGLKDVEMKQAQLAQKLKVSQASEAQNIMQALQGKPEQTVYGAGMEGPTMNVTPAVQGSTQAALAQALKGESPFSQTMAAKLMEQQFKEPKKTSDIQNYEYDVKNSGFKGTFNDWLTGQKRAGASNQIVNTGKDLAGQVGDISKESRISAMGAVQSAESANRIINAVDTNQLFTGVGANQRLTAAQIADGLGLGGKDTTEKIANTRQAVQGLAQLTLQGRKQMRGEGAITESEGALAQRAMSGDVSLTAGEIRQLAEAAKRSAKFQYSQHQNIINAMKQDPNTRGLVPYYDVPADTNIFAPRQLGSPSSVRSEADAILGGGRR